MLWSLMGASLLATPPAWACGGFFCDLQQPVDQTGEQIIFIVDEPEQEIEVHVQIAYQGPAEEFSWLLPAPAMPVLTSSAADIFTRIARVSEPTFAATPVAVGECLTPRPRRGKGGNDGDVDDSDAVADTDAEAGVQAIDLQVGPYDAQILQADDVGVLVSWLVDNGYGLPDDAEALIEPYVSAGGYFVGLKLRKGLDVGDLSPIAMRYAGTEPVIPLRLTAVAAAPDLRLEPFVLAASRAVPDNYLHVQINPFAIDWLTGGSNYDAVITRAADEAGAHAFATDFAGEVSGLEVHFWRREQYPIGELREVTTVAELDPFLQAPRVGDLAEQQERVIPVTAGTLPILRAALPNPAVSVPDAAFYDRPTDFVAGSTPVDGAALADALDDGWVEPMRLMQGQWDQAAWLTRLRSSISADEMDLDPRFVWNADMGPVDAVRSATLEYRCEGRFDILEAPRRLVLADGRAMDLPSLEDGEGWATDAGEAGEIAAERVEQTGRSGAPVVITDRRAEIDAAAAKLGRACGCDGVSGASTGAMLGLLGLVRRRRA